MKKIKNISIIITAIFLLTTTLFLTPCISATKEITPQEKVRENIESGFNAWVHSKNLRITTDSYGTWLSEFLRENPSYQTDLRNYVNLTKPDLNKVMPLAPDKKVPLKIDSPFAVVNVTIDGKTVPVSYSKETFQDGTSRTLIKIGCGNFDPQIAVEEIDIIISINSVPVLIGEYDYLGVHFYPEETQYFFSDMDTQLNDATHFLEIFSFLYGFFVAALTIACPPAVVAEVLEAYTITEIANIGQLQDQMHDAADQNEGLYYCFQSTYVNSYYYRVLLQDTFIVYARHFHYNPDYDTWDIAYPRYSNTYSSGLFTYLGEALTLKVHDYVNTVLGNGFNNATWYPCDATWPLPSIPDPSLAYFVTPSIVCYDDSTPVDSNVYIDGHASQSINSVFPLIPGLHSIGVDKYIQTSGGYGYIFNSIDIEGNTYYDNIVEAELSTNSTITAHYSYGLLPTYTLTVNAFDFYLGEEWPYEVDVYLDSNYIGTTPLQTSVIVGEHTLSVDSSVYSQLWGMDAPFYDFTGDFEGCNLSFNPVVITIGMYSDSTVNARYWPW
jgi:hypothetical protein